MNTKKILIIAAVALASIAAGYGLVGLRPADGGAEGDAGSLPILGGADGTPRVVYIDETASYRAGDDDRWSGGDDDDRYEHGYGEHDDDDHHDGDHDDD